MGAHVLADGKGKKIAITSLCADITYAQAEVLFFAEKLKGESISPFIVAFPTAHSSLSVERFLEAYKGTKDLDRLEAIRAKILADGFESMIVRDYMDDFQTFQKSKPDLRIGRSMENFVDELVTYKRSGEVEDMEELVETIQANPLHAGVHLDFKATVPDETWVADAAKVIRKHTPERWLRRLLAVLRFYFKGEPKALLPHKNDRCPCDSSRKYGKCCGAGVEIEDPEECKLGKHESTEWREVEGKYVRSCERCYRVYEAPWFDKTILKGTEIVIIGCRACNVRPTLEEIETEVAKARLWNTCGSCGKAFGLEFVLLEHQFADGKHLNHWMATEVQNDEDAVDIASVGLGKAAFLHKECFMKALPQWPRVAKPRVPGREISMGIPKEMV